MTWLRLHRLHRLRCSRSTAVVIRCRQHPLIWAALASPRGSSVGIEVLCSIFTVTISLYGEMIDPPSQRILSYVKLTFFWFKKNIANSQFPKSTEFCRVLSVRNALDSDPDIVTDNSDFILRFCELNYIEYTLICHFLSILWYLNLYVKYYRL